MGMLPGQTTDITIEDGKNLVIKYIGYAEQNDDGTQNLVFELNGERREVAVKDKTMVSKDDAVVFADINNKLQIGASIPGGVSKVMVKKGDIVTENKVCLKRGMRWNKRSK
jgi:pyruvate carboxylase